VGYHYNPSGERPETHQPVLSILETAIDEGHTASGEDPFGIGKGQAVLGAIVAVVVIVPFIAPAGM
jgi:hypothetical protein